MEVMKMRCRRTVKIIIDIAIYLIFVALMQEHLWSDGLYEWLGITHNGSSSGASSISTVAKLCSDSTVLIDDYFTYSGNNVDKAESDVDEWLSELGYKN